MIFDKACMKLGLSSICTGVRWGKGGCIPPLDPSPWFACSTDIINSLSYETDLYVKCGNESKFANLFTLARNIAHAMQVWKNNKLTLNVKSVKSQFWLLTRPFNGVKLIVAKNSLKVFCIEFKTKRIQ